VADADQHQQSGAGEFTHHLAAD
jgi:hypothetical protein